MLADHPPALVIHAERHRVCRGGRVVVRGMLRGDYGNGTDVTVVIVTATLAGPRGVVGRRHQTLIPDDNRFVHFGIRVPRRVSAGAYRLTAKVAQDDPGGSTVLATARDPRAVRVAARCVTS